MLATNWETNVVLLRRARLFADRCSQGQVRQFVQLGLTWTLVRVLIAVPEPRKRMALAKEAMTQSGLVTAEQLSQMVGPYAGQQNKGRPSVELRRVERLSRDLASACRKCHLARLDSNRLGDQIQSTRKAVQDARKQLQVLDEALAESVRR